MKKIIVSCILAVVMIVTICVIALPAYADDIGDPSLPSDYYTWARITTNQWPVDFFDYNLYEFVYNYSSNFVIDAGLGDVYITVKDIVTGDSYSLHAMDATSANQGRSIHTEKGDLSFLNMVAGTTDTETESPLFAFSNNCIVRVFYGSGSISVSGAGGQMRLPMSEYYTLRINEAKDEAYNDGYEQGLVEGGDYELGFQRGYAEAFDAVDSGRWASGFLGNIFKAPSYALNQFIIASYNGHDITLGHLVTAVIALSLGIAFLKFFAGG